MNDIQTLTAGFAAAFGTVPTRYFSAPGRTEIGGNHTDHQRGKVLAAAVNLDTRAAVGRNHLGVIRVLSQGYPMCQIRVGDWQPQPGEEGTTAALIRGVAACFAQLGCPVGGFDAYVTSTVLPGSGLSSSAAFEVLMGTVINALFFEGKATPAEIAAMGQRAENVHFGKPCGLMDQMASAGGGLVTIDFADADAPKVQQVDFDFSACGYALCIIDTGADHADLTPEYGAIPAEMGKIANYFGKKVLSEVLEEKVYAALPALRQTCGDRAVLRAIHYYNENRRVDAQVDALERGDFEGFLEQVRQSGRSSYMLLQNVIVPGRAGQEMALALALCEKLLAGQGACRVHGGGFAGTVQAFVPHDRLEDFCDSIERVLGQGSCHVLDIRPRGGIELDEKE